MSEIRSVEELRQQALERIRANQIEEAIPLFDQALALAENDETRELININKAGAFIALGESTSEVQQLPRILMRRRTPRHTLLSAYHLGTKFHYEHDFKKAAFYFGIASEAADEVQDSGWKAASLVSLGAVAVYDSRNDEAIEFLTEAIELLGITPEQQATRAFATQNLGYCKLMTGDLDEGITLIHSAVELMIQSGAEGYSAEANLDLCLGYLEKDDLESARHFGRLGLESATETRQIRNAHYLLGEAAYKAGDVADSEYHFEQLATLYPNFPNLKNLLVAIDLRKMVNFKL